MKKSPETCHDRDAREKLGVRKTSPDGHSRQGVMVVRVLTKRGAKSETHLYKIVEVAVMDEKQEERERGMIRDLLGEHRTTREEEDEARNLIEEMQRNLDEPQNKSFELEWKLNRFLWENVEAFDKKRGRPRLVIRKPRHLMQSRDTKNLNVDKDFDEILRKSKNWVERVESTRTRRFLGLREGSTNQEKGHLREDPVRLG